MSTVNGFAVNPSNPQIMFAAMRDGIFRTDDGGQKWMRAEHAPRTAAAVTINPKRPSEIYVATVEGKIHRSEDGGTQWQEVR